MPYEIGWVHDLVPTRRYRDVRCDNCEQPLDISVPSEANHQGWKTLWPENALGIRLEGHYGGYFDDSPASTAPKLFFCEDCTNSLLNAYPAFAKALAQVDGMRMAKTAEFKRGNPRNES